MQEENEILKNLIKILVIDLDSEIFDLFIETSELDEIKYIIHMFYNVNLYQNETSDDYDVISTSNIKVNEYIYKQAHYYKRYDIIEFIDNDYYDDKTSKFIGNNGMLKKILESLAFNPEFPAIYELVGDCNIQEIKYLINLFWDKHEIIENLKVQDGLMHMAFSARDLDNRVELIEYLLSLNVKMDEYCMKWAKINKIKQYVN